MRTDSPSKAPKKKPIKKETMMQTFFISFSVVRNQQILYSGYRVIQMPQDMDSLTVFNEISAEIKRQENIVLPDLFIVNAFNKC